MDHIDGVIVRVLKEGPRTARELIADLAREGIDVSQSTLSRRMRALEAGKHVAVQGQGRSTRYLRDPYHDWFAVAPNKRQKVGFRFDLLEDYEPNVTRWISAATSARLVTAGGGRKLDASTYSRAIAQKLLVDLSYASSAMEGNTYSYLDTQVLIEFGQVAEGKAADETQMILNHKEAIVYLIDNISEIQVDVREIKTLHALLSRGLLDQQAVGAVRRMPVDITGSAYMPIAAPAVLEEQLARIAEKADLIADPFEQSLFLMVFISYLQFFLDVNKRTGRLACNIPLLRAGLAPLSFMDVDKAKYVRGLVTVYELGRVDLIAEAYVEGYVASAARYDAYAGRDRKKLEVEYRHRTEIYGLVKSYVHDAVDAGAKGPAREYAMDALAIDDADTREAVAERVADIVSALSEGNHVAYGVTRKKFDAFTKVPEASASPSP